MNGSNTSRVPRWRERLSGLRKPTVLYEGFGTTVTTAFFESAGQRYPVVELAQVRRAELTNRGQPRVFELWGQVRGRWIKLFQCQERREFGQVCRALVRAREYAGLK